MQTHKVQPFRFALLIMFATATPAAAHSQRLTGTVSDSVHRAPLADATVLATPVAPTRDTVFHSARTDANGHFAMASLQVGKYLISVEHAFTDSIGLAIPPLEVQVTAEGTPPLALALPSVATLRRTLCGDAVKDTTLGVMLGVVRRGDGSTVSGANVVFEWTDVTVEKSTLKAQTTRMAAAVTTDSMGVYRACGLPAGIALFVQAQRGAKEQSGIIEEHIGEALVLVRELVLGDSARAQTLANGADSGAESGPGRVRGIVRGDRERPIANAQVHLFGTSRVAKTNAAGEFRLGEIPTGTQGFEIIALGYAPRRFRAEVSATTEPLTLSMRKLAVMLDSIRVTARRVANATRYSEFEERAHRRHFGHYITEEEIDRRHPFLTSDLLRMVPGLRVTVNEKGEVIPTGNRGVYTLRGALSPADMPVGGSPLDGKSFLGMPMGGPSTGQTAMPRPLGGGCLAVFVDGVPSFTGLNDLPPSWVHGIEIYRHGEAPAKYSGSVSGSCSVVLIWSK